MVGFGQGQGSFIKLEIFLGDLMSIIYSLKTEHNHSCNSSYQRGKIINGSILSQHSITKNLFFFKFMIYILCKI